MGRLRFGQHLILSVDGLLAVVLSVALVATGVLAVRAEGFSNNAVDAHDGNAWLLRGGGEIPFLVSVNGLTQEASAQLLLGETVGSIFDIHQDGRSALLQVGSTIRTIDSRLASVGDTVVSVPGGNSARTLLAAGVLASWIPSEGRMWLNQAENLGRLSSLGDGRPIEFDQEIDARLSVDGDVWVLGTDTGTVALLDQVGDIRSQSFLPAGTEIVDFTIAGDEFIAASQSALHIVQPSGSSAMVPLEFDGAAPTIHALQLPGEIASFVDDQPSVLASTSVGLVAISLVSGRAETIAEVPFGLRQDVAPAVAGGCGYGLGDNVFAQACVGAGGTVEQSRTAMERPRLRLVRGLVFYEDWRTDTVAVWPPGADRPAEIEDMPEVLVGSDEECSNAVNCARGGDGPDPLSGGLQGDGSTSSGNNELNDDGRNDPPVAVDDEYTLLAGRTSIIDVVANDRDPDGDPLGVVLEQVGPDLSVVQLPDRRLAVTASSGGAQTATFSYRATDGRTRSAPATVEVRFQSSATGEPIVAPDSLVLAEETTARVNVLLNDVVPNGQSLVLTDVDVPSSFEGGVVVSPDGLVVVTADRGSEGTYSLRYAASDGSAEVRSVLNLSVVARDQSAPVANPDFLSLELGSSVVVDLLANDFDLDRDGLQLVGQPYVVDGPSWVRVEPVEGGLVRVTALDLPGSDAASVTIGYSVTDGQSDPVESILSVDVQLAVSANRAPVPLDDQVRIRPGESRQVNVLANDSDPDPGDVLRLGTTPRAIGEEVSAVASGPGSLLLTVAPRASSGVYEVIYDVSDPEGRVSEAVVQVYVPPGDENQVPAIVDGRSFTLEAGGIRRVPLPEPSVLFDPDGDAVSVDWVTTSTEQVVAELTGTPGRWRIDVVARLDARGPTTVRYGISDGRGETADGSFVVDVRDRGENTRPVANDDEYVVSNRFATALPLLSGGPNGRGVDADPDGHDISIAQIRQEDLEGSVLLASDAKSVVFTPRPGWTGETSFTYSIVDAGSPSLESDFASVFIRVDVESGNTPPIANADAIELSVTDGPQLLEVLANDSDPDPGESALLEIDSNSLASSERFEVVRSDDGRVIDLRFAPIEDDLGRTLTVRYRARDPKGALSPPAEVSVRVIDSGAEASQPILPTLPAIEVARGTAAPAVDVLAQVVYAGEGPLTLSIDESAEAQFRSAGTAAINERGGIEFFASESSTSTEAIVRYTVRTPDGLEVDGILEYRISEPRTVRLLLGSDGEYQFEADGEGISIPSAQLLANDRGSNGLRGAEGQLSIVGVDSLSEGLEVRLTDGGQAIRVAANEVGRHEFRYTADDGVASDSATVAVSAVQRSLCDLAFPTDISIGSLAVGESVDIDLRGWLPLPDNCDFDFSIAGVSGNGDVDAVVEGFVVAVQAVSAGPARLAVEVSTSSASARVGFDFEVMECSVAAPDLTYVLGPAETTLSVSLYEAIAATSSCEFEIDRDVVAESSPAVDDFGVVSLDPETATLSYVRPESGESLEVRLAYSVIGADGVSADAGSILIEVGAFVNAPFVLEPVEAAFVCDGVWRPAARARGAEPGQVVDFRISNYPGLSQSAVADSTGSAELTASCASDDLNGTGGLTITASSVKSGELVTADLRLDLSAPVSCFGGDPYVFVGNEGSDFESRQMVFGFYYDCTGIPTAQAQVDYTFSFESDDILRDDVIDAEFWDYSQYYTVGLSCSDIASGSESVELAVTVVDSASGKVLVSNAASSPIEPCPRPCSDTSLVGSVGADNGYWQPIDWSYSYNCPGISGSYATLIINSGGPSLGDTYRFDGDSQSGTVTSNTFCDATYPNNESRATLTIWADFSSKVSERIVTIERPSCSGHVDETGFDDCVVPLFVGVAPAQLQDVAGNCQFAIGLPEELLPGDPLIGRIATQSEPEGARIPREQGVLLGVGEPICVVPDVVGLTQDDAAAALRNAHCQFGLGSAVPLSPGDPGIGLVQAQDSQAGTVLPQGDGDGNRVFVFVGVAGPPDTGTASSTTSTTSSSTSSTTSTSTTSTSTTSTSTTSTSTTSTSSTSTRPTSSTSSTSTRPTSSTTSTTAGS